jgi:NADH:ubiquinone oxidoreductase subunit E
VIFDDLRAIQLRYGFLPKAELEGLSQRTHTPLYQIHSVASFYPHFHLAPPAKAEIRVCADMSCHLNGACELRAELQRRFAGCRPEGVQIREVSCLGRCDHAPAMSINDQILTEVTVASAEKSLTAPFAAKKFESRIPSWHARRAKPTPTVMVTTRNTAWCASSCRTARGTTSSPC